jgi:hypothetical protein
VTDRFDTAAIRTRVLDSWAAAAVRFREDANLEEDLVLGAYRDRVLVELAQNAADAATRAGQPGRLRFTLDSSGSSASSGGFGGPVLTAANTGAPLDASGVVGLATLRASAKRDEQAGPEGATPVGRFGVGFAAVLAVSDEPALLSRQGSVRFSAADARAAVQETALKSPELEAELNRRLGRVPALRLPFPADGQPPQGYDTAVVLPLRDTAAETLVRRLLNELDDALLLSLPQLAEVVVDVDGDVRTLTSRQGDAGEWRITDGGRTTRWRLARAHGALDPMLLANRPVEERAQPFWSVTWAVPIDAEGTPDAPHTVPVVHAPTPTDEPLGLPALLIATFPLDPTRRHVTPGPLQDFLLDKAADAYAELIEHWPARKPGLLRLVPGPIAEGALDAELRDRILKRLAHTAFLPAADGSATLLQPGEATVLVPGDEALVSVLVDTLPGLVPAGWDGEPVALTALGVHRMEPAELVETLVSLRREPTWWGRLYAALDSVAGFDPGVREALAELPVPLVDGRTVRGAAGVLLPEGDLDDGRFSALRPLGLRIAHPAALVPGSGPSALLERLGARPARPRAILADPAVRGALIAARDELPEPEPELDPALEPGTGPGTWSGSTFSTVDTARGPARPHALAEAVLTLVEAADPGPRERFGLGDLPLLDDRGEYTPARELLLPGSQLDAIVRPGVVGRVDRELVRRWGPGPLRAVGVLDTLTVLRVADVLLDVDAVDDELLELDGFEDWLEDLRDLLPSGARDTPPVVSELLAVRDLDLVAPAAWPAALSLLAGPELRPAVVDTVRVMTGDGGVLRLPSYTSWWLSRHAVLDGRCPADLVTQGGLLTGLYDFVETGAAATEAAGTTEASEASDEASSLAEILADAEFLVGLGVRSTLDALLASPGGPDELLDRLADPAREVTAGQLVALYGALAEVPEDRLAPPNTVRALAEGEPVVADAEQVVVVDAPDLQPLLGDRPCIPVPARHAERLADLLELGLVSEAIVGEVTSEGERQQVPDEVLSIVPEVPDSYLEHEELILDGESEVAWRVVDGEVHASTFDGLARALAWAAGRWDRRHLIAALLAEPDRADELAAEEYFE